jgi:hypothetical protein
MPADPSDAIRARMQTAIVRLEYYARGTGSLKNEMLDVLATVGLVESELEGVKAAARAFLRRHEKQPPDSHGEARQCVLARGPLPRARGP